MLPGKTYTPADYLAILWRRRWFVVVPLLAVSTATAVVSMFLPDRYRASAAILILPQRVPEDFVQSTVTATLNERLSVIRRQIMSRTRLERIIQEFNLYERERRRQLMEDVIEEMRKDIGVTIDAPARRRGEPTSFSVSFESENARTAMQVTERLASFFVQENLSDRSVMAEQTNQFLQAQLEEARRRLEEQEKTVQEFRRRNNGQLPDQVGSNLSLLQSAQTQLQTVTEASNRDRDRLQDLQKNLADILQAAASTAPTAPTPRSGTDGAPQGVTAAQQLEAARTGLRAMELRLKPDHPDVGRARRVVAELEAKAEAEALQQPLSAQTPAPVVAVDRALQTRLESVRREIQDVEQRLESERREIVRLQAAISTHGAKVQAAPALESELTKMTRDYTTVQETYANLLRKSSESQMSLDLERRQIGEQFRVVDGARLPQRPVSPDRRRINMLGVLGGLAFGVGLVALLEYRDTSFKTDDDVVTTLSLPVLAVIPVMTNASERRGSKRRRLIVAASASFGCMLLAAAVVAVWRYDLVDAWLR